MAEQLLVEVPGATELLELATQGPPGPPGPPGPAAGDGAEYFTAEAIGGHRAVALDAAGLAMYASADDPADALRVAGISLGAAAQGDTVVVQARGLVEHGGWAWVPGVPVLLGLAGNLTQAVPVGAAYVLVLGQALSPTRVLLGAQPPIALSG